MAARRFSTVYQEQTPAVLIVLPYGQDQHPVVTMDPLADVDNIPSPYCVPLKVHAFAGSASVALGINTPDTIS